MKNGIKDITGQRFGSLVAIKYVKTDTPGASWLCKCDCGGEHIAKGGNLRAGTTISCGCRQNRLKDGEAAFNLLYSRYQNNAAKRGISFNITKDLFRKLTKGTCFYCGCEPAAIAKTRYSPADYIYNGVDRYDNSVGYTDENVVTCCGTCNLMKREMSHTEFLTHIKRILDYHGKC